MTDHTCIASIFGGGCSDGAKCPSLRERRVRRRAPGGHRRGRRPVVVVEGLTVFDLFSPSRYRRSADRPPVLDVVLRRDDLRRIARSHPAWSRCLRAGWDPDDLLQELMLRAWQRQSQGSRFDPSRAGIGKYLYVLSGSVLSNLAVLRRGSLRESLSDDGFVDGTEQSHDLVDS